MQQQNQYTYVADDVRRASKPNLSRANITASVAIPPLKLKNATASAGGGVADVNWVMPQAEAPEPKFGTNGPDTDVFAGMGESDVWTFAGAFKKRNGVFVPARAIIEGIVSEWEPDEMASGEMLKFSHVFQEVTHYEFVFDGNELFYMDVEEREIRFNGKSIMASVNRALGI
ncbi:Phage tail tube protein FII [Cohaesibacter sp. ES.047]|uniref:phage major tail tube protein n=1 Tax=Cohaesibacter sp. ES.047 TaxID=1798205 RepID=UPI000BB82C91|nr:phage major tail tube protein [Cohaesibacter sp. ES.047]SNY94051.1 Phage tail tube protein FII [Cohaesibacter sp. ES.047]